MTVKSVAIIGVGSFGGFLCREILKYSCIEKVVVIDFDIVVMKNIKNSIYLEKHENRPKVVCLKNILGDARISVINKRYEDIAKKEIQNIDVVIDCRDEVSERGHEIDLSISIIEGYTAIFDFRKDPPVNSFYTGVYVDNVDKNDLIRISEVSSKLIMSEDFKSYCNSEHIYTLNFGRIDQDLLNIEKQFKQQNVDIIYSEDNIALDLGLKQLTDENLFMKRHHIDRVYEYDKLEKKIYGMTNATIPIFKENHEVAVWIYNGPREELPYPVKIEKGYFKSEVDVKNKLQNILLDNLERGHYDITVSLTPTKGKLIVQLLEVTKGA